MKTGPRLFVLPFTLLFVVQTPAQQSPQPTPQRDPQALAVLAQMVAVTGWSPGALPQDAVATGTVTRFQGNSQDTVNFTLKLKGFTAARIEVQDPISPITTVINDGRAAFTGPSGSRVIPRHAALSMRPITLPFFVDLVAIPGPNVGIRYAGTETVNGQLAHRIEFTTEHAATRLTLWMDTATLLPSQIEYLRVATNNLTARTVHVRRFSDYRVVGALAVPFHQEEFTGGSRLYTIQLTSAQFNAGLADTEFAVPVGQD